MRKLRESRRIKYSPSKTKPGQALIPAELLKRHLAGTLPDIQHTPKFTYDENGKQISEDLSHLELHELHELTLALQKEFNKRQEELRQQAEDDYKKRIIEEHTQQNPPPTPGLDTLNPQGPTQKDKAKSAPAASGPAGGS